MHIGYLDKDGSRMEISIGSVPAKGVSHFNVSAIKDISEWIQQANISSLTVTNKTFIALCSMIYSNIQIIIIIKA